MRQGSSFGIKPDSVSLPFYESDVGGYAYRELWVASVNIVLKRLQDVSAPWTWGVYQLTLSGKSVAGSCGA